MNLIILAFILMGCSDSDKLLVGHNFNNGEWLLVNVNYAEKTLQIIEDEAILLNNKNGIWVTPAGDCGGTTCDGFLKLYKGGKLVAEDGYLTRSAILESAEIKNSYKDAKEWTVEPINEIRFKQVWDSLKSMGCYPTIYRTQPDDKDIIWAFRIEEN